MNGYMNYYNVHYLRHKLSKNFILVRCVGLMYYIPSIGQTSLVKNANGSILRINFNRNWVHHSTVTTYIIL